MSQKYKKYIIGLVIIGIVFIGIEIFWGMKSKNSEDSNADSNNKEQTMQDNTEKKEYEVLVFVRNQTNPNPEEDKKTSMKKGYVVGVYDNGHKWAKAEKSSYLILKMNLTDMEKTKLTQPVEREIKIDDLPEPERKSLREEGQDTKKETIGLRAYKINLDKIGFESIKQLSSGQPFEDKIFGWEIVEKI
ncbi:MAG TPA: hypothetical protein ENJ27_01855 [Candidatus Moranbacteria bacterium]|nr:hypothetical protein [Candidatus Moranbacteria bacterium]